jgi:hypothetical protein
MRPGPVVLSLVLGGMLVPGAAAQDFRANVVSWSPNVISPGEPVSVVLSLRTEPAQGAAIPADGRRDVAVVIRGNGRTRRFATRPLGSGRYRATIVFPAAGAWHVRVRYRANGALGETDLGKGGACVGACGAAREASTSTGDARLPIGLAIGGAVVLLAAAALRRRRSVPAS